MARDLSRFSSSFMQIDFSSIDPRDAYGWLVSMIVPRPIAWVSSQSETGVTNLAPFSFFNGVTSRPPTLMFVPVTKIDGTPKDTLRNIEATKEFVVNLVSAELGEAMSNTAAALPYDESEFERFAIESAPSDRIPTARCRGPDFLRMSPRDHYASRRCARHSQCGVWPHPVCACPRRRA